MPQNDNQPDRYSGIDRKIAEPRSAGVADRLRGDVFLADASGHNRGRYNMEKNTSTTNPNVYDCLVPSIAEYEDVESVMHFRWTKD